MTPHDTLNRGREAFGRREWTDAYGQLSAAGRDGALKPQDLERLAIAAHLIGRADESADAWARAHHERLNHDDVDGAARCAFWLAFGLLQRGERARASAWIARARGLLDDTRRDSVVQGYLLLPVALQSVMEGDAATAYRTFCQAAEIASRFADPNLVALARHSCGRALIRLGEIRKGVTLLDEAMVAVEAGEVSPLVVGDVYCSVIEGCLEVFDLRRAQEWTSVLTHWCESQPDLVPFSGQCLVRRAEILQLHGLWPEALDAAKLACERFLRGPDQPAIGAAYYQRAEILRLRGEIEQAEDAYREASRRGRKSQAGLAQLRLAQGDVKAAAAAIRGALDDCHGRAIRARLLPAHVEIMVAAADLEVARASATELSAIAEELDAPFLHAAAAQARGAVLLAGGDAKAALVALRHAWRAWQEVEAPYEAARARLLMGLACRALEDTDAAEMEFDAARWVFQQLEALPDLARVEALSRLDQTKPAGGLTARELQVLRLVAAGKTNRAIGAELFISERTVERHLSNIFTKLDVSSRASATAYAYEHQLV
jgi:DNA-binding CsgD family transcriptional regulator